MTVYKNNKTIKRQYNLTPMLVGDLTKYCITEGYKPSEVVEMAIRKFLESESAKLVCALTMVFALDCALWAQMGVVTETELAKTVVKVVQALGYVVGTTVLAISGLKAAWIWNDDQARAIETGKGGVIGGVIGLSIGGIATWISGMIK